MVRPISASYDSLLSGEVAPMRLSDFTQPEKEKLAKKEKTPEVKDEFIGPDDSEEQVKLDLKSLIG